MAKNQRCTHRLLRIETEKDRCSWGHCLECGIQGPKKHSYALALVAWINFVSNDHPNRRRTTRERTRNKHT